MQAGIPLVEVRRGDFLESLHSGHWAIVSPDGQLLDGGGNPDQVILPRSSLKPVQALPLIDSGAAKAFGLTSEQIALSAASHQGAPIHTTRVRAWLNQLGKAESDLRCGTEPPRDAADRARLRDAGLPIDQTHMNCSGKHTGFLTFTSYLKAGPEYIDPGHPIQLAMRDAVWEMTGVEPPGFGIDGCSAPNFATTVRGLANALAKIAAASEDGSGARERAAFKVRQAMWQHPDLVAGEGRACTRLMRLLPRGSIAKTGAEAVFAAALPEQGVGIALKIADGTTRASEVALTALLVRLGALDPSDPRVLDLLNPEVRNSAGRLVGSLAPVAGLASK